MANSFRIDEVTIEPESLEVVSGDSSLRIEAKAMDVLVVLAEHAPRTVSSSYLLDNVWAGLVVSDNTLHRLIGILRKSLGDDRRNPRFIETVQRRGYRLIVEPQYLEEDAAPLAGVLTVYSDSTSSLATQVADQLRAEGLPVQSNPNASKSAENWSNVLRNAFGIAKVVVFFLPTDQSDADDAVSYVLKNHKIAVVVTLPGASVPLRLRRFPRIEMGRDDGPDALLAHLRDELNRNAVSQLPAADERPSVVVLPFRVQGNSPEDLQLSDGLLTEIVHNLSLNREYFVIGSGTSLSYRAKEKSISEVARELKVRYAIAGTLQKLGDRIRLFVELCTAESGRVLWSERFESLSGDLFQLQDDISQGVAVQLQPRVARAEIRRVSRQKPDNLTAWEIFQKARRYDWSKAWLKRSIEELSMAIEADPGLASAHALLSARLIYLMWYGEFEHYERAINHLETALRLEPSDPFVHVASVIVHAHTGQPRKGIASAETAIELNPNLAEAWAYYGFCLGMDGRGREGMQQLDLAFSLSPRDPLRYLWHFFAIICLVGENDYEQALHHAQESVSLRNDWFLVHMFLATVQAVLGNLDEAADSWASAKKLNALVSYDAVKIWLQSSSLSDEEQQRQLDALGRAGCE